MSAENTSHETDTTRVWEMMQKIDICMLVTRFEAEPRARPMSTIPKRDEGSVYLLTEATSSAANDIGADGTVLLAYQGSSDHLSVGGTASVMDDMALVKRLWSPGAEAFWPDGPEASNVVAIKVDPDRADYWDGPNRIVSSAKFLFSLVSKQPPDMGERGVVNL
jgi:general stress protein 26